MPISTKPLGGMRDFLGKEVVRRQFVIGIIRDIYSRFGFSPLETPALENISTLMGKYGEEGNQLIYRVLKRREGLEQALRVPEVSANSLSSEGLRYDLTIPLARVISNYDLPRFYKRFQIQPVWRADSPGLGRFREFFQCDVDITGTTSVLAEVEVISAATEVLKTLGFNNFEVRINSRPILQSILQTAGINPNLFAQTLVLIDKLDKIGIEKVRQELISWGIQPDLLLDLISCEDPQILKTKIPSREVEMVEDLIYLLQETSARGACKLFPSLARGLSYYTGTIFEIVIPGFSGSVGGGGRYDQLIGTFGPKKIPAVGFSLGLERILVLMEEQRMFPEIKSGPDLLLCWKGVPIPAVLKIAKDLRARNILLEIYPEETKLTKQLQYANTIGVRGVVILCEEEFSSNQITMKRMDSGEQKRLSCDQAEVWFNSWV